MLISIAKRPGKAAAKALWTWTIIVIIYTTTAAVESESNPGYFRWRTEGGGRPVPGVYLNQSHPGGNTQNANIPAGTQNVASRYVS